MRKIRIRILISIVLCLVSTSPLFAEDEAMKGDADSLKILSEAVQFARAGDRDSATAALKKFAQSQSLDYADQQNTQAFGMAAHLFSVAGMVAERDELYRLAIQDAQKGTPAVQKDALLQRLASTMSRYGTSGTTLIDLSKSCANLEATARLLTLAILAESQMAPKATWEDFAERPAVRSSDVPKADITATKAILKQVVEHIALIGDADTQSVLLDRIADSFEREPFASLLIDAIKACVKLNKKAGVRIVSKLRDKSAFAQQCQELREAINNLVVEAEQAAGGMNILNPQKVDILSPEFEKASSLLKLAVQKAAELDVNDGRGAVLLSVAQTQSTLGDLENSKQTLAQALQADKRVNTNDVLLEQIANLQIQQGDFEKAIQTTDAFYSFMKTQTSDRVFQALVYQLIVAGDSEQARKVIEKISDEAKRQELEKRLKALDRKPLPQKDTNEQLEMATP